MQSRLSSTDRTYLEMEAKKQMNKNAINITIVIILFSSFIGCQKSKDDYYFNGKIRHIKQNNKVEKYIASKPVSLNGVYSGMIAVYDSLLICWHPELQSHFFNVFHVDSGEEIGSFVKKGQGPEEVISVNCIHQLFKKGSELMSLLYARREGELLFWNISRSVESGVTVYDTIVPYKNDRIFFSFYQSEDILLAYKPADFLNNEEVSTPFYEKRTIYTNELIQNYPIYKQSSVQNTKSEGFFYTWDAIKPDGSKIVQVMWNLPQINILDTSTGELVGIRTKDTPTYSLLETDMKSLNKYYNCVQADDKYIYATYWGKEAWVDRPGVELPLLNTIHVFNWEGELICELTTDRSFFRSIWLDQVRNRLYTLNVNTDEVYYLDLHELGL